MADSLAKRGKDYLIDGARTLIVLGFLAVIDKRIGGKLDDYVTKDKFGDYVTSHNLWGSAQLSDIQHQLDGVRQGQLSIDAKLDKINERLNWQFRKTSNTYASNAVDILP